MSSFLYLLLITFVGLSTVNSQDPPPPIPECKDDPADVCYDCYNLGVCFENEAEDFKRIEIKCAVDSPKTPYCDKNKCVEKKPEECNTNINIKCFGEGVLPNPLDCHSYLICGNIGEDAIVEECLPSYIYSHLNGTCLQNAPCYQFTEDNLCLNNATKMVVYPPDASIYARCPPEGYLPIVKQCVGQYKFVVAENKCDAVCRKDHEKIRYENCCNKYHECFAIAGGGFNKQTSHCPKHFNDKTQACDNLSCDGLLPCNTFFDGK